MRIAIVGIGSLGTIVGALLTHKGCQVDLVDAYQENVDALNKNGATITGFMSLTVPVKAYTPKQLIGVYDLVILLTKQTHNAIALQELLPHLNEKSVVCSLQNGIPEESVSEIVGKERTIGGAVLFGATWIKPGISELTSPAEFVKNSAFDLGEIDGSTSPRILAIQSILNHVGHTTILPNLMSVRWTKVLVNSTFSGMSAALGCTFGDILDSEKAMICLAYIADETIKVARKSGYSLITMVGLDMSLLELDSFTDIPNKLPLYHHVWDAHRKLKASMLQDLEKGRLCEIDYINGVVAKNGRKLGIATPFNDKVIELVKEAEARKGVNDLSYLNRFDALIAQVKNSTQ